VMFIKAKIMERYFLFETVKPMFACLFIITFILILDKIVDLMNLIIEKQLDVITVINLFALTLPYMLALSVPMSVLTSTIMAFGRMSVDQELTAAKSTGIDVFKMTKLLFVFILIVTFGMAYFNDFILPETNHLLKNLIIKVTYKKPITAIPPGTFTTLNNVTIYAKDRTDEALIDLIIFNLTNSRFPQTVYAKKGEIYLDPDTDLLKAILYDGEMQERDQSEPHKYQTSKFEQYTFFISNLGYGKDDSESDYRGDREMNSIQMKNIINDRRDEIKQLSNEIESHNRGLDEIKMMLDDDSTVGRVTNEQLEEQKRLVIMNNIKETQRLEKERQIRELKVEIHKKYSLAAACLVFLIVGLPIGMMTKTSGIGVSFSFSSIIFIIFYVFIVFGEEFGDKGTINPDFSMWITTVVFFFIGLVLIHVARKEKSFDVMVLWNWAKTKIPHKGTKNRHKEGEENELCEY
jgi:lipopolysaccharide export system permease protein